MVFAFATRFSVLIELVQAPSRLRLYPFEYNPDSIRGGNVPLQHVKHILNSSRAPS